MEIFLINTLYAFVTLLVTAIVMVTLFVSVRAFIMYLNFWNMVNAEQSLITVTGPTLLQLRAEFDRFVWNRTGKPESVRVIALREMIQKEEGVRDPFERNMALSSDMYGQVKYLLASVQLSMAVVFWFKHLTHRRVAMHFKSAKDLTPIEMEVASSKYFALATLPLFGTFFKSAALKPLREAVVIIEEDEAVRKPRDLYTVAWHEALIRSKIFFLTKELEQKWRLKHLGLTEEHARKDRKQMERIRKWFGFHTIEEMFEYCED